MGIESSGGSPVPEGGYKPTIDVFAAQNDYTFSVVVHGRGDSDSWRVSTLATGLSSWTNQGTFTGKSADVTVDALTLGQPIQMQVRVQLRKSNEDYGQVSDAVYVTVSP